MSDPDKLLSDLVVYRSYAQYLPHQQRRENFEETVNRYMTMNLDKFAGRSQKLSKDIINACALVHDLKIVPSMRCLQFGGTAIEKNNARNYNCSYLAIKEPRAFSESLFLLLSGCGVGYSVQRHHVGQLPRVQEPGEDYTHSIHDSVEGWAQSLDLLVQAYFYRTLRPVFDFSKIRARGERISSSGSKAPGPEPLKHMLALVEAQLKKAVGRRLSSLEVHDLVCIISNCVLAGGIRRSALLSLFDNDDQEMLTAKHGEWWHRAPWRARANNSAVLHRNTATQEDFKRIFDACRDSKSGEPGFFWTADEEGNMGTNPCLSGDTLVALAGQAPKSLRELAETGEDVLVYCQDEMNNVVERLMRNPRKTKVAAKVYRLLFENGMELRATDNHRFFVAGRGYLSVSELREMVEGQSSFPLLAQTAATQTYAGQESALLDTPSRESLTHDGCALPHHTDECLRLQGYTPDKFSRVLKRCEGCSHSFTVSQSERQVGYCSAVCYMKHSLEISIPLSGRKLVLVSIEYAGTEDVYNGTVDDFHNFFVGGKSSNGETHWVNTRNCGEISLLHKQFCNLTSVNQTTVRDRNDFMQRVRAATLLGTLQAAYTDFPYLSEEWKTSTELESLLGVSFTGIADAVGTVKDQWLVDAAALAKEVNDKYSRLIGINPAARITTVKPEGSTSAVMGASSGIHPRYAEYYIRRVRINEEDALAKYLAHHAPDLIEADISAPNTVVFSVPQKSPKGALNRHSETALQLLGRAMKYNNLWVAGGHRCGANKNNVSLTVYVKEHEWDEVFQFMWDNRNTYTGVSILPSDDHSYQQAPFEECSESEYERLLGLSTNLSILDIREDADYTDRGATVACSGGSCEIL